MKKTMKKLVLNRETLVSLDQDLGQMALGGSGLACPSGSCINVCPYSEMRTCVTCDNKTCGTNYC